MSNTELIADLRRGDGNGCKRPNELMRRAADTLEAAGADLEELRAFIAEMKPWTGDDNWHKYDRYRTPELVRALKGEATEAEESDGHIPVHSLRYHRNDDHLWLECSIDGGPWRKVPGVHEDHLVATWSAKPRTSGGWRGEIGASSDPLSRMHHDVDDRKEPPQLRRGGSFFMTIG